MKKIIIIFGIIIISSVHTYAQEAEKSNISQILELIEGEYVVGEEIYRGIYFEGKSRLLVVYNFVGYSSTMIYINKVTYQIEPLIYDQSNDGAKIDGRPMMPMRKDGGDDHININQSINVQYSIPINDIGSEFAFQVLSQNIMEGSNSMMFKKKYFSHQNCILVNMIIYENSLTIRKPGKYVPIR